MSKKLQSSREPFREGSAACWGCSLEIGWLPEKPSIEGTSINPQL